MTTATLPAKKMKLADSLDAACASASTWLSIQVEDEDPSKWVPLAVVKVRTGRWS